jgi:predicted lipoprotein with Yx(FWY)xxD motif
MYVLLVYAERVTVANGVDTMRNRWLAASGLAAAAVVGLAACGGGGSTSSTPPSSSSTTNNQAAANTGSSNTSPTASGLKFTMINGKKVLTDAQGFVLYWFAIDTPTKSNCNGTCATYWPPVTGTPTLAAGVKLAGKLGTIARANGTMQATYDGHPLYTFKSDTSAGKDTGNGINTSGGLWWAMTASGAKLTATSSSGSGGSSGGSGGGSYGY